MPKVHCKRLANLMIDYDNTCTVPPNCQKELKAFDNCVLTCNLLYGDLCIFKLESVF